MRARLQEPETPLFSTLLMWGSQDKEKGYA